MVIPPCYRERYKEHDVIVHYERVDQIGSVDKSWPRLDADIEENIRDFATCQSMRNFPPEARMHN